jgi:cytochrome c oxidase subunit 3
LGWRRDLGASYGKLMMWFSSFQMLNNLFRIFDAYGFLDLNLLKLGLWRMKFLLTFHLCMELPANVLCGVNDFYLNFSSVTMVLAVDAGHQMKQEE